MIFVSALVKKMCHYWHRGGHHNKWPQLRPDFWIHGICVKENGPGSAEMMPHSWGRLGTRKDLVTCSNGRSWRRPPEIFNCLREKILRHAKNVHNFSICCSIFVDFPVVFSKFSGGFWLQLFHPSFHCWCSAFWLHDEFPKLSYWSCRTFLKLNYNKLTKTDVNCNQFDL